MSYFLRLAHPSYLLITLPLLCAVMVYRWYWRKSPTYTYALAHWVTQHLSYRSRLTAIISPLLRFITLAILAVLIAQPQLVDTTSSVHVEGVDIALVLDVSGSMQCIDDPENPRSRIDVAKQEAIRFIDKRTTDPIGLVLFGKEAVSRIPLTLDKKMVKETVAQIELGVIPAEGTVLARGITLAASRLKNSRATSKIMIVLTDGQPSPEDSPVEQAIDIAKRLGIKVYTIGIGAQVAYIQHPDFGFVPVQSPLNKQLLQRIAQETGGQFFEAANQQELRAIYDHIDRLEKTEYDTTVFSSYYDIFIPFIWLCIGLLASELLFSTWWFVL